MGAVYRAHPWSVRDANLPHRTARPSGYLLRTVLIDVVRLIAGGFILYLGAEWLVSGAAGLARSLGIPPLIIGLTVIGYGTSAPELTVSVASSLRGSSAIALGNAIGSNIANLGLILGMTALVSPPRTDGALIRREIPLLLLTTAALPLVFLDGRLGRLEAACFLAVAIGFTAWMVRRGLSSAAASADAMEDAAEGAGALGARSRGRLALIATIGLGLLIAGGELFVGGATAVARAYGISERVIGLTVVAIGTSLPELATSLVAATRGHADIAIGNVIGSNLFNILFVLGAAGVIRPIDGDLATMRYDLWFLGGMTLLAALLVRTERVVRRWEGALLVLSYVGFLVGLVLRP